MALISVWGETLPVASSGRFTQRHSLRDGCTVAVAPAAANAAPTRLAGHRVQGPPTEGHQRGRSRAASAQWLRQT